MYSDDIYNEMKCGSVCKVRNSVLMLLYGNYPVFSSRTAVGKKVFLWWVVLVGIYWLSNRCVISYRLDQASWS